ncbi:MAG: RAD55 family ATPase [Thermodesulfobacteriota bacterium]
MPGFDTLLGGGLVEAGLYLLEGHAGTGKTILANQIAFNVARAGKRVLVITLIAESHGKLLEHLRGFDFFDQQAVADRYVLLSGFNDIVDQGLDGLLQFISTTVHELHPTLFVLDGFATAREYGESPRDLAKFLHALNALVTAMGCTTILLAPISGTDPHPEHTLVDGLIELSQARSGLRRAREIEIHKMRGGKHLTGQHVFTIRSGGVRVYPRLETVIGAQDVEPGEDRELVSTGIPRLDEIVGAGSCAARRPACSARPASARRSSG